MRELYTRTFKISYCSRKYGSIWKPFNFVFRVHNSILYPVVRKTNIKISCLIFFVTFIVYFGSENCGSGDTKWVLYTTMSIIKEGNTDLDEYAQIISKNYDFTVEIIDGHVYNIFPVGISIISIPFVYVIEGVTSGMLIFTHKHYNGKKITFGLNEIMKHSFPRKLELFIASFISALTSVFIYNILLIKNVRFPLLSVFIFAFCTSTWSTASRALWQHGPSMLMLTLTLFLVLKGQQKAWIIQFAAIPLAFSYIVRPSLIAYTSVE